MFSDLQVKVEKSKTEVTTWNRTYVFGENMLDRAVSNGTDVLAGPVYLDICVEGKHTPWIEQTGYTGESGPERNVYYGQAIAGPIRLNTRRTVEKDGLIWYDVLLLPQTHIGASFRYAKDEFFHEEEFDTSLDSLTLVIPVQKALSELFHFWPRTDTVGVTNSEELTENGLALPFKAVTWLGNEQAGIAFYAESDENWQPADPDRTITVSVEENAALMKVHLLDSMPEMWRRQLEKKQYPLNPLRFSFGLQTTPVKPYEKKAGYNRDVMSNWQNVPADEAALAKHLDTLAEKGVKWYTLHEGWSKIQNYGEADDEAGIRRFVDMVHQRGMRTAPYFGYEFSTAAPEFWEMGDSCVTKTPENNYCGGWHRSPHQIAYRVCYHSDYSHLMIDRCVRAMEKYGFDGVYLDGTFNPDPCANAAHGCGYTDLDGNRHATYPLRAVYDHVKRLSKEIHQRGGIVEVHQSSCCVPMLLAYCDNYFDGEHLVLKPAQKLADALSRGAMRAEFTGRNWGVPIQFCCANFFGDVPPEDCYGLLMLYGTDIKAYGNVDTSDPEKKGVLVLCDYWKHMDAFGADAAKFVPFWQAACPVFAAGEDVACSAWVKEDKILALAVNLGTSPVKTEVFCKQKVKTVTVLNAESESGTWLAKPRELYFVELSLADGDANL